MQTLTTLSSAPWIRGFKVKLINPAMLQVLKNVPRSDVVYQFANDEFRYDDIQNLSWPQPPATYHRESVAPPAPAPNSQLNKPSRPPPPPSLTVPPAPQHDSPPNDNQGYQRPPANRLC